MPFFIRHLKALALLTFSLIAVSPVDVMASVKAQGTFTAVERCPAFQSIRKKTNPGNISTQIGTRYQTIAINKPQGDWVQLYIKSASPQTRWVNLNCGNADFQKHTKSDGSVCTVPNKHDSYVLAVSWQPGFCEHANFKGEKPECTALNNNQLTSHHLTLHGLWPNKKSCGIKYGYCSPASTMDLSAETIAEIAYWMPNFHYQTTFGAYQWKKHGTCQSRSDDEYFLAASNLVQQTDASPIGQYVKQHIGQRISINEFQRYLSNQLGQQAVKRLQLSCLKGKYLQEIRLNLPLRFEEQNSLISNLNIAPPARSFKGNCNSDIYIED
ncbi:ribonuclease T2 family protein [Photobacterium minamisatsumaniensis]|uniref:ribonuclease T2 family protein n=1 Tax=Photobacterium minamisatsumaniensis TaxID=2910233 RepID=UPI003D0D3F4A